FDAAEACARDDNSRPVSWKQADNETPCTLCEALDHPAQRGDFGRRPFRPRERPGRRVKTYVLGLAVRPPGRQEAEFFRLESKGEARKKKHATGLEGGHRRSLLPGCKGRIPALEPHFNQVCRRTHARVWNRFHSLPPAKEYTCRRKSGVAL